MTTFILFAIFVCIFFAAWYEVEETGSKCYYLTMVISGICAIVSALMFGGVL